jgi:hypothetical protein
MKEHSESTNLRTADFKVGEEVPRTALKSFDSPNGRFDRTGTEEKGRTTTIEGWANPDANTKRDSQELATQDTTREKAGRPEEQDASHIIPHSIGGRGEHNLVMMSETMNRSHYKGVEEVAIREAKDAAKSGEGVYVKATVTWGDNDHTPRGIRYEVFRGDPNGASLRKMHDQDIRTDREPGRPLSQELLEGPDPGTPRRNHEWNSSAHRPKGMIEQ